MISATVEAGDSGTTYIDKPASELQSNIRFKWDTISGTLHNVDSWPGFSGLAEEQSGHYLVLKLTPLEDATIKTKIGDSGKEVEVTDGFCVYLVKNTDQKIYVTTTKLLEEPVTKVYYLNGLYLEPPKV